MDSSGKMLSVLRACPLKNLSIRQQRAEEVDKRESFDVVTGRAIAPLAVQMEVSAAWAKVGGSVVPFRTPNDLREIEKARFAKFGVRLESTEERELPGTEVVRVFPIYRKTKKTPAKYPRTWAQIRASARTS